MNKIIVSKQDVINTFSKKQRNFVTEYLKFKNNQKFKISKGGLYNWKKGGKPRPLRLIEKMNKKQLLPLKSNNKELPILARIIGALFGDGTLSYCKAARVFQVIFRSKFEENIRAFVSDCENVLKSDLSKHKIYTYKSDRGGCTKVFVINNSLISRLLVCLGAPIGDKVSQPLKIPSWIVNSNLEVKRNFLDGLFSSEISVPRKRKHSFVPSTMWLSLSKIKELSESHLQFLYSIKQLLQELNIKSGKISRYKKNIRKNGDITYEWRLPISNSRKNLIQFYNTFPLLYAREKKEQMKKILLQDPFIKIHLF